MKLITFIGITAHWIDSNFRLHDQLLAFHPLEGSHNGENLASCVMQTLIEFNLTDKLYCITTDNASNNSTLIESLSIRLQTEFDVSINPDEQLIPCMAHVINLAIGSFLKNLKVIYDDKEETGDEGMMREQLEKQSDKDFAITMMKVREITKVRLLQQVFRRCGII